MVTLKGKKLGDYLLLANGLVFVLLINLLSADHFFRLDLTEEGRYTIKEPTRELLRDLDDEVYVEVFLEGELNAEFRRFRKAIEETLTEFSIYSDNKVKFIFTNPEAAMSDKAQSEFMQELGRKGITPTRVVDPKGGQVTEKIIFPGALISYGGLETGVMLLKGNKAGSPEEEINQSIEGIEFELANGIYKLVNTDQKRVGLITGHGELDSLQVAGFRSVLQEYYDVRKVDLSRGGSLENFDAVIIAKPTRAFSETDKFRLDQYIMHGGKAVFLIDKLEASMDSASKPDYFAFPVETGLDDQLFRYGVRINLNLVQDRNAGMYPVVTDQSGGKPRIQMMEWPFFPLINHYAEHPLTRNLDAVLTRFISSIDTVKSPGIVKTPLMKTSEFTRVLAAPVNISIDELRNHTDPASFNTGAINVGYLLEGSFTSLFKNRFVPDGADVTEVLEESVPTKLVVIGDGDVARNEVNPRTGQPQMLGFDPISQYTFANQELLMNAIAYLLDGNGLIAARNKQVKIRPLDDQKVRDHKLKWQLINMALPIVLLALYGAVRAVIRKRKFASF